MRFMMLMIPKGYETAKPGTMPEAKAVAAMMKYNEELAKAGVLLSLDGLHPPSMGARVHFEGGSPKVTDGPFAEAKEVLGGYWMIQVKSRQEAIDWAKRCPAGPNEVIEIRQVQEMSEFPEDVQKAAGQVSLGAHGPKLVQPYLSFNGRCEEAIEFYRAAIGAQVITQIRFKDIPNQPPGMVPPGAENKLMHAAFKVGETTVLASDGQCTGSAQFEGITLSLTAPSNDEAERLFAALADGGKVTMPLAPTFFSTRFGMVTDRFGVAWMVSVG